MTIAVIADVAHVLKLSNQLNDQRRRDGEFCDILLRVSGKTTLPIHSCVLSAVSPFFRELISCERKPTSRQKRMKSPQKIDLVVPGIGRQAMDKKDGGMEALADLLDYIYTGKIELKERTIDLIDRMAEAFMLNGLSTLIKGHVKGSAAAELKVKKRPPKRTSPRTHQPEVPNLEKTKESPPGELPDDTGNGCARTCGAPAAEGDDRPTAKRKRQVKMEGTFRMSRPNRFTFTCRQCDFASSDQPAIRQHLLQHPGSSYVCVSCDFVTRYSAKLLSHLREAGHERETRCSLCGHVAATAEELGRHLDDHDHPLPFPCAHCTKRFPSRWGWKTHLRCHTNERPFVCELCDFGFKQKGELKAHMLKHDGAQADVGSSAVTRKRKSHLCEVCGFRTPYSYRMRMHERQHTGNLFRCPQEGCDHQSTSKYNIRLHLLTHSEQKLFQCEVCGKSFKDPSTLRQHTKRHNLAANLVRCDHCSFTSLRRDKVKRHSANVHGGAQQVEPPPVEAQSIDLQSLEYCQIDAQVIDSQMMEPLSMETQIIEARLTEPQDGGSVVTFYLVQEASC